jgi:predicted PurR-regulated permease PerM
VCVCISLGIVCFPDNSFTALIVAIPLGLVRDYLSAKLQIMDRWIRARLQPRTLHCRQVIHIVEVCVALLLVSIPLALGFVFPAGLGIALCISFAWVLLILALKWESHRPAILTFALVAFFLFLIVFPTVYLIKNCVDESIILTTRINDYLRESTEFQDLIRNYENSTLYKKLEQYIQSWGYNTTASLSPQAIKMQLISLVTYILNNITIFFTTSLNILTNIKDLVFNCIIFFLCLFYFVLYKERLWKEIVDISPFTEREHVKLSQSLKSSVSRIFVCSLIIGTIHFWTTFLSFTLLGLELKCICAVISAFLAIVPVLSSWVLWVPVVVYLLLSGAVFGALFFAFVHVVTSYIIDPQVYSYIPGNPYYVGMSVFFGISAFGVFGAFTGPLLAGILVTTLDIFKSFYTRDDGRNENETNTQTEESFLIERRGFKRIPDRRMSGSVELRSLKKMESPFNIVTRTNSTRDGI